MITHPIIELNKNIGTLSTNNAEILQKFYDDLETKCPFPWVFQDILSRVIAQQLELKKIELNTKVQPRITIHYAERTSERKQKL